MTRLWLKQATPLCCKMHKTFTWLEKIHAWASKLLLSYYIRFLTKEDIIILNFETC